MKAFVVFSIFITAFFAHANEAKVSCSCKCVINWWSTNLEISADDVGLPESASRADVMARSGLACRNHCEQVERETHGAVMYFGYRSGMCR